MSAPVTRLNAALEGRQLRVLTSALLITLGCGGDDDPTGPNTGGLSGRILFTTSRQGPWETYVMDADGSNPINLTNHPAGDGDAAWSPDGTRIAFASNRDGNDEIYVMDADGSNPVRLTDDAGADWHPSWSPDGTKIVFAYADGQRDLVELAETIEEDAFVCLEIIRTLEEEGLVKRKGGSS